VSVSIKVYIATYVRIIATHAVIFISC